MNIAAVIHQSTLLTNILRPCTQRLMGKVARLLRPQVKVGVPYKRTSQIRIINASPAALGRKSARKPKYFSEKKIEKFLILNKGGAKLIGHDCPDRKLLLIRVLQVNHGDCMCTRQGARNWRRPACLNRAFACVIVSNHREPGEQNICQRKIKIAVGQL